MGPQNKINTQVHPMPTTYFDRDNTQSTGGLQ